MFVNKSHCFTLVDRGKGMAAMQSERELAASGDLRVRSNIGKGQIKAADYVLVPDLVSQNADSGGNAIGGLLGGLIGNRTVGALVGGINMKKKTADVVLTVTDVRSSEQVAMTEGHATKTDLGWGAGGGVFSGGFGGAGATGYANTEIGQVITLAYLQAYTDLVAQLGGLPSNASAANAQQAVTMSRPGPPAQAVQRQGRRGARPRCRDDAVSHRQQGRLDVGGRGRTRQQGLGELDAVRVGALTRVGLPIAAAAHNAMRERLQPRAL